MSLQPRFSRCLAIGILLAGVASVNAEDKFGVALKLDHFKFYKVEPVATKADVSVQGQFDTFSVPASLPEITMFANPVSKDGGRLINPQAHLTWYKLLQRLTERKRAVEFENQFGVQEALLGKPVALLVPTERVEEGSKFPEGIDHFKVYEVLEARPLRRTVTLKDQFGAEEGVTISRTMFFCVPVIKTHGDQVTKIVNEKAHLTLYGLSPPKLTKLTTDQFGKHKLSVIESTLLALPTVKIAWKAIEE
ncbi:MAG: hypothetical protein O3C40_35200 [Planctomycetota bacterium]|nr:hypothetical protein [Planctomycetota bacterium]